MDDADAMALELIRRKAKEGLPIDRADIAELIRTARMWGLVDAMRQAITPVRKHERCGKTCHVFIDVSCDDVILADLRGRIAECLPAESLDAAML